MIESLTRAKTCSLALTCPRKTLRMPIKFGVPKHRSSVKSAGSATGLAAKLICSIFLTFFVLSVFGPSYSYAQNSSPSPIHAPNNSPSSLSNNVKPISQKRTELLLSRAGFPVGIVDGIYDTDTRRALCLWRDYSGRMASRRLPSLKERFLLATVVTPKVPTRLVTGINISRTCQTVSLVAYSNYRKARYFVKFFKASTGQPGFETRTGTFRIYSQTNDWLESNVYPGAMMYKPKFFSGGQALHGSASDSLVLPYPASHGCIRLLHSAVDYLWANGYGIGTMVLVYGDWLG